MDEKIKKKEKNNEEFNNKELKQPKDDLFADLIEMEDEITTEAIELVEHALSLVDSKFFDDAIEILRKAITLYSEIGKSDEIDTINQRISEIYILKEQAFREAEFEPIKIQEELGTQYIDEEQLIEKIKEDLSQTAEKLIEEANKLVEIDEFDEAIEKYDEVVKIFQKEKKESEIEKIYELIDKCYDAKAEFLKRPKVDLEKQETSKMDEPAKLKDELKEKEKAKRIAEIEKNKQEEEDFRRKISYMTTEAEKMEREYELNIKKGNFDLEPPFNKIIEIYKNIQSMLLEREWKEQANIYFNQIKLIKQKLDKDKRLREVEARKRERDKEYLESLKIKKIEGADLDRLKAVETKRRVDERFQQQIDKMVSEAEKLEREYELEIRKGNFDMEPPFENIIKIYEDVRELLLEKEWKDQANLYWNQIRLVRDKLENDKRLRKIEAQKIQKQKQYEEMIKTKKEDKTLKADLEKLKEIETRYQKELEDENFENKITILVDKADNMVRKYELAIRYGQFFQECVYPTVINIYKEIRKMLLIKGWKEEAQIYYNQIKLYEDKLEQDKKLREIEAQKRERDMAYLKSLKTTKEVSVDLEKMKTIEVKYKEDEIFQQKINDMVTNAERTLKEYELDIRKGNFDAKPPFKKTIEIYSDVREMLIKRGWVDQARVYLNQIEIIKQKQEKDIKLREIETQKIQKQMEFEAQLRVKKGVKGIEFQKLKELDIKKKKGDILIDKAFSLIDEAERIAKEYEFKIKTGILFYKNPYDKVISLYKEARKIFLENKWETEASHLISTIKFYKDKQKKDENLRALEVVKLAKAKEKPTAPKIKPKKKLLEKEEMISEFEKEKKNKEELSSEAFEMIDKAEKLAKVYEFNLKEGLFLDCPYKQVIDIYRKARKRFEKIGWEEQSANLISTINHYKEKLEADKKLRTLEKEKIEKQKKELEERQKLAEKARKEKEAMLKQREKDLLVKSKEISPFETQKEHAFRLMDQAKYQLNMNNFDLAIELYKESENIFSKINWPAGIRMIKDSIQLISKKREEFGLKQKVIEEKEAEALISEKELGKKIAESQDLLKLQQEKKRKELLRIQEQKAKEKEASDRAYDLLEQGTRLLNRKKFDEAYEKYIVARNIFTQIGWVHEVSRINNDLLLKLKKDEKMSKKHEEYKIKKIQEEKEIEALLKEAEIRKEELKKVEEKEKREKLFKIQISDKIRGRIKDKLNEANIEIIKFKYNEGILILKDVIKMMDKLGWKKEIEDVNEQIQVLKTKSQVPLIVLEEFDANENMEKVKSAYEALDKAQMSLLKDRFMKAISELNEAKFNLSETKIRKKFIHEIDAKIDSFKKEVDKRIQVKAVREAKKIEKEEAAKLTAEKAYNFMDKCKKAERRNRFEKAIECAMEAKNIFSEMGPEWIKEQETIDKYIDSLKTRKIEREQLFKRKKEEIEKKEQSLKKEEADFKARIAARREERRNRIKELMKKK